MEQWRTEIVLLSTSEEGPRFGWVHSTPLGGLYGYQQWEADDTRAWMPLIPTLWFPTSPTQLRMELECILGSCHASLAGGPLLCHHLLYRDCVVVFLLRMISLFRTSVET